MNTINNGILPFIYAEGDNDINASFDEIQREVDLAFQLKQARAELEKTRAALQEQTTASQRIHNERQLERILQGLPNINPKTIDSVTELLLRGDGGELEQDKHGKLREKYGTRSAQEVAEDYIKLNTHFTGNGIAESATSGAPKLYKSEMSAKQIAEFVTANGREAFHALPRSKPEPKK